MARPGQSLATEGSVLRGLVLESRDLRGREAVEMRIDYELAVHMDNYHRKKPVDQRQLRRVVEKFIDIVDGILKELEDTKRKAEIEETNKINAVWRLLRKGAEISSDELKTELEKLGHSLKSSTISGLRQESRRGLRLRRKKAPFGFFLKKLQHDRYLDRGALIDAFNLKSDTLGEHKLSSEIDYLIGALNRNPNEKTLAQLRKRIETLVLDYRKDLAIFLDIEIDRDIGEARKLHMIDHYIKFLKKVGGFKDLIGQLEGLKSRAKTWVYQDVIDAKRLVVHARRTLGYAEHALEISKAVQENKLETYLNRQPFSFIFHRSNEKGYVNDILNSYLPDEYGGRKMEYVLEVDYIWYERDTIEAKTGKKLVDPRTGKPAKKISAFFTHAVRLKLPTNAKKIMELYRGETNPETQMHEGGLVPCDWLFRRVKNSKIKLMIEIKAGRGKFIRNLDEHGLDHLVKLIERFNFEDRVLFLGTAWPLDYLKPRLPRSFNVLATLRVPFTGWMINLPLQKTWASLWKFGPGIVALRGRLSGVDAYFKYFMASEESVIKQAKEAADDGKFCVGGMVKKEEQFNWLIKHGGRGCLIWKWPKDVIPWLSSPPVQ